MVDLTASMGEYTVYSSTQIPHILRTTLTITCRHPRGQAPGRRAGRRRRLRLQARGLPRGRDLPGARQEAAPADQVDRGAQRGLRRNPARARDVPDDRAGGDQGRHPQGRSRQPDRIDGRVPAHHHPGHPDAGRVALRRSLRLRGLRLPVHERVHQQHVHRRLPRRRTARGHVRHRAGHGRARPRAQHGPDRASP